MPERKLEFRNAECVVEHFSPGETRQVSYWFGLPTMKLAQNPCNPCNIPKLFESILHQATNGDRRGRCTLMLSSRGTHRYVIFKCYIEP